MLKDFYPGSQPTPKSHPPAQARPESPYDMVGGSFINGVQVLGRPRWEVENERRKAEREDEMARMEMEYRRWMMEQSRANPYGMNIRDLIYGAGK